MGINMRYRIIWIAVICLAASLWTAPAALADKGLELLPADTEAVLTFASIEHLYKTFGMAELRDEFPDDFAEFKREMTEEGGFDFLDLAGLREFGLDPAKPIHVGFVMVPSFAVAIVVPSAGDAGALVGSVLEMGDADFNKKVERDGVEIYGHQEEEVAIFAKGSSVVMVWSDPDEDGGPALEAAKRLLASLKEGTIAKSKAYKKAAKKFSAGADVTFYMGPNFYDKYMEMEHSDELDEQGISSEETRELYEKWGLSGTMVSASAKFDSDRLTVDSYSWIDKESDFLDWYEVTTDPTAFLTKVPSQPMLAAVTRLNFAEIWESLEEFDDVVESDSIPDFDETLGDASEEIGVDIETELIEQFNGNVVFIVNSVQMMNIDALILLQLTKPEEFATTMTALVEEIDESIDVNSSEDSEVPDPELIRGEYEGIPYYTFMVPPMVEVSFGVVDDHLVIASSQLRFQAVINGGKNFIDDIGNADVKKALKDPQGSVFYMDFQKLATDLEAWGPMLGEEAPEMVSLIRELSELVSVGYFDDDGSVRQTMTFTGSKPDVWKRLLAAAIESESDDDTDIQQGD